MALFSGSKNKAFKLRWLVLRPLMSAHGPEPAAEVSLRVFADQHLHNRLGVFDRIAEPGGPK